MRKVLICALALGGFAASAQAADLNGVSSSGGYKDSPSSSDSFFYGLRDPLPDALTYAGVTVYGTVDVGYANQTNGLGASNTWGNGLYYSNNKLSKGSVSTLTDNAMQQSTVGVKIEESLGQGFAFIGKAETGFNPISGEIANGCESLVKAAGFANSGAPAPTAYSDSSRCGGFNGDLWAGVSNPTYGTLTGGRTSAFANDAIAAYDPNKGSVAFSLLGYSGGALAGIGSTETSRWDNSLKYVYQYGPLHAGGQYSFGGNGTEILGNAYGANVGGTYKGFSLDASYEKENGAVALSANSTYPTGSGGSPLTGTITNNEAFIVAGKYTYDLGGGFKDEGPSSKVTFFSGYAHIDQSNPDHDQAYYNGDQTLGGYSFYTTTTAGLQAFGSDKILQTEWVGAAYETGAWTFTGAYYHEGQNSYTTNGGKSCSQVAATTSTTVSGVKQPVAIGTPGNCSGDINFGSFVVDYKFDKHFDVYAGVSTAAISGGLGNGYLADTNTNIVTGVRLKF